MVAGGFHSVTDQQRAFRVWNLEDDLYDHWMIGARVTLYQKKQKNWRPAAYLAYGNGSFQNFEYPQQPTDPNVLMCLAEPMQCETPPKERLFDLGRDGGRHLFEARLFLESLYLGVNVNNGQGRDDMRLMVGLTVKLEDITSIFERLGS